MTHWNTPHVPKDGEKPYEAPRAGRDWPKVPVCKWDTTLEVGFMHLLNGDLRAVRMARNTMLAMHRTIEAAAEKFAAQIEAADNPLPGIVHPENVGYWRGVAPNLAALAAEHWDHVRGLPHAKADGERSYKGNTRVDIF